MSPVPNLQSIVATTVRTLRRDVLYALAGAVSAMVAVLFLVSWAVASLNWWPAPSAIPLVLELLTASLAGILIYRVLRTLAARTSEQTVAVAGEHALGLPEGSVQGVLELSREVPNGTSPALFRRAEAELNRAVTGVSTIKFSGTVGVQARRQRLQSWSIAGALVAVLVLLGFMSPSRSRAGWAPLLSPVAHLSPPPLPPITVQPGNVDVPRGTSLAVRVQAPLRSAVLLQWRSAGSIKKEETLQLSSGNGAGRIPNVDAPVIYWVTAPDGAVSDTFSIRPTDPLLVSDLTIDVTYPSYLGRPPEQFQAELPSLEIPEGTELRIQGRATRSLGTAVLSADSGKVLVELNVEGAAFRARWFPKVSGFYQWNLTSPARERAELVPPPFDLRVIPDLPPEIEVTYPAVDTTLSSDLQQTIVADARDDHGLLNAVLVSWRTSSLGQRDPPLEQPLTLEGDADRALIRGLLDATDRRLLPGDTLSYFVAVTDNSPRRQTTVSPTYRLRLPSMDELRRDADDQASDLVKDINELSRTARDLEKQMRDLNRRAAGDAQQRNDRTGQGNSQGNPGDKQMDFNKAEQARGMLERQQQMVDQAAQMRERVESLQRAMEAAGLRDPELQKRLQEMRELYDKMLTPELRKKLEELKQNVDKMNPEEVQKALEELAKQQQEFREQLERQLELMRRAAAEQEMNSLAQQAKELATQQQAVSDEMKRDSTPNKDKVEQQKEMQQQADSLSKALSELMKRLSQQGEGEAAKQTEQAKGKADEASGDMKQAAEQAGKQQGKEAAESGKEAADKLNDAAKTLEDARKQMAEGWKKETQDAMEKATQDALSLAQKQNEILDQMQKQAQAQAGKQQQQQAGQSIQPPNPAGQQQQQGQQGGQQQKAGQQQGGQQQKAGQQQQGGQQQGGRQGQSQQGQQQQQGGQQQGGQTQQGGQSAGGQPGADPQQMKNDQAAQKQGLEQLGKNLSEAGQRSAMLNKDVGSALGRANLSMEQVMKALEQGGRMPTQEAAQTLDALNRLALELLKNQQQMQDAQAGTGLQQALEQLAELAKQQGGLNGQSSSLAPLNLAPQAMSDQLNRLAKEQREIAQKLGGMNNMGGREDVLGRLDELAKEANDLARDLAGGRLDAQTLARQEKLFHKLLDAGRTLERDEFSEERKAERAGAIPPHIAKALRPGLLDGNSRYKVPTEEELRGYSPAMRRQILQFFEALNRTAAQAKGKENR